jgi:SAM-dependent methyltransferase
MHVQFLDYLADPETKEPLALEKKDGVGDFIESGMLKSSTSCYPIVKGVPRFVASQSDNYARSFGYQWHRWPRLQFESENAGKPMEGLTRGMWERITGTPSHAALTPNTLIADIGCGPGRFIDVARSKGARVIGLDYSSAVEVAAENFRNDPNVCICQADALNLPLRPNSLDGAFTIGVLHHTPAPESGVKEAYKAIRNGGWFALCVYGKGGYYDFPTVQLWRRFFKFLWPAFKHRPALLYTYFTVYAFRPVAIALPPAGKAIRAFFPFINLRDISWSLLDTFDSLTPSYQSAHESYEVFSWLKLAGFVEAEPTDWGFTSFRGIKKRD